MKIKYSQDFKSLLVYWWVPKYCNMKPIIQFIILLRFSFMDFIHFVKNDIQAPHKHSPPSFAKTEIESLTIC